MSTQAGPLGRQRGRFDRSSPKPPVFSSAEAQASGVLTIKASCVGRSSIWAMPCNATPPVLERDVHSFLHAPLLSLGNPPNRADFAPRDRATALNASRTHTRPGPRDWLDRPNALGGHQSPCPGTLFPSNLSRKRVARASSISVTGVVTDTKAKMASSCTTRRSRVRVK